MQIKTKTLGVLPSRANAIDSSAQSVLVCQALSHLNCV